MSTRAAFHYPWFPETWGSGATFPNTVFQPSLGAYDSSLGIAQTHVALMQYARIKVGITSWWGPSSAYDSRIALCLQAAERTRFKWCLYYEPEGYSDPSVAQLDADLSYVLAHYASHPNYLKRGGKPVIFSYADPADAAAYASRWKAANRGRFYDVLKVFSGYEVAEQPNSWHQYGPAAAVANLEPWCYTISPGFHKFGEAERLARDIVRWEADVLAMSHSPAEWHLITTFNEWGEGTAVEPELGWGSTYLDVLARHPDNA